MPDTTANFATSVITQVTDETTRIIATVIPTVIAIEQAIPAESGTTKLQIAVNAILAGSQQLEGVPVPSVAAIAGLVNLTVGLLNAFGLFNHGAKPNVLNHTIPNAVAA